MFPRMGMMCYIFQQTVMLYIFVFIGFCLYVILFYMTFHIFSSFLSYLLFVACKSDLDEYLRAQDLQHNGAKLEALKMYEDIVKRYPNHPDAQKSKQELEILYHEAAIQTKNPYHALLITKKQLETFPEGQFAQEARLGLPKLQHEAQKHIEQLQIEKELCAEAKKTMSVEVWRKYIQMYPHGECYRDAEQSILDIEKKLCSNARKGDYLLWKLYLESFPSGTCAEEAKSMLVQKEPTEEDMTHISTYRKECRRLAEKCPKLEERFQTLIEKKEFSYLQGSYFAYLNNWLEAYNSAAQAAQLAILELEKSGYRVDSIRQQVQIECVDSCAPNTITLKDVELCKKSASSTPEEASTLWKEYEQQFPRGGCLALIPR